jgi:hypothetical protein
MAQKLNQSGRNIGVQIDGHHNTVRIYSGQAELTLVRRHRRKRAPVKDLDLLNPYSNAIPLIGREDQVASLRAWLDSPKPIAIRGLTGRAGSGKTRLALELCAAVEGPDADDEDGEGWLAGFLEHDELTHFPARQNLAGWDWPRPLLAVVDYAAASAQRLRAWLLSLAENQPPDGHPPLRLLLLERHADTQLGWWADLIRPGSWAAPVEDLLDPAQPVPLPTIADPEQRRAILSEVPGGGRTLPRAGGGAAGRVPCGPGDGPQQPR